MRPFRFQLPGDNIASKQPVIRLKASYYQMLCALKAKTGLPLGNIVEQCIDYALENMEEVSSGADT